MADKYSSSSLRTMGLHEIYHSKLDKFQQSFNKFGFCLLSFNCFISFN